MGDIKYFDNTKAPRKWARSWNKLDKKPSGATNISVAWRHWAQKYFFLLTNIGKEPSVNHRMFELRK